MNLSSTIIPKSDQMNSDDLIAGPRTIKITSVSAGSAEQPVSVHYEGGEGRPWKPCKSMRRVLIELWGADGSVYAGRRVTLFRDASVTFGKDETGGIRISHASHITAARVLSLTVKRGQRKPYRVEPLPDDAPPAPPPDRATLEAIGETKAREGTAALKAWWASIKPAEQRAVQDMLASWKETAASADTKNQPAS